MKFESGEEWRPDYQIFPSQRAPVICADTSFSSEPVGPSPRLLISFKKWGLVRNCVKFQSEQSILSRKQSFHQICCCIQSWKQLTPNRCIGNSPKKTPASNLDELLLRSRKMLSGHRGILTVSGFFEWRQKSSSSKERQPFFVYVRDRHSVCIRVLLQNRCQIPESDVSEESALCEQQTSSLLCSHCSSALHSDSDSDSPVMFIAVLFDVHASSDSHFTILTTEASSSFSWSVSFQHPYSSWLGGYAFSTGFTIACLLF